MLFVTLIAVKLHENAWLEVLTTATTILLALNRTFTRFIILILICSLYSYIFWF